MKKLRNIVLIVVGLIALLIAGFGVYFKTNIVPLVKENLNEQLDVPVEVEDITFSGIKTFPRLGIELTSTTIEESTSFYNKPSVSADKIYLLFDLFKLIRGKYEISRVEVEGAELLLADLDNQNNYSFFKSDTTSSDDVSFLIDKLILRNTSIVYNNQPAVFMAKCYTPTAVLRIQNKDEITALHIDGLLNKTIIEQEQEEYINQRNVKLKTQLLINTQKELISFSNASIGIEDVELQTEGQIVYGKSEKLHIRFSSNKGNSQNLISLLPTSLKESISAISVSGVSTLNGTLSGSYASSSGLAFNLNYRLEETNLKVVDQPYEIEQVGATGTLSMPDLSDFSKAIFKSRISQAHSENNRFSGNLMVRDFDNPKINWNGTLDLDAPFIFNLSENPSFKCSSGRITYNGGIILNQISKNSKSLQSDLILNGELSLDDIAGELEEPSLKISNLRGNCKATPSAVDIEDLLLSIEPSTTFHLQGRVIDYISLVSSESKAKVIGDLEIKNLNINDFISSDSSESTSEKDAQLSPVAFKLNTTIDGFSYNDFNAREFRGVLASDRNSIVTQNAQIKALDGVTRADLAIKPLGSNVLLDVVSTLDGINITQLFQQFNNFEQNEITHENLSGVLSGKITAKILLDNNYDPVLERLYVNSDIEIKNGSLKDYKTLQELSKFVDIEDLMNVQFEQLNNTIEIFDGTIFIPRMEIKNSALNLELEGTHTFENEMKYQIGLSVGELLAKKANWIAKRRERRIENNANGGMTAYIIMEGTPDDLKIRYDRATVKETAKEELKKERDNFIKALKGEETFEKEKDYDDVWDE